MEKTPQDESVEYKPLQSPKKPFKYKKKWYTRDELKKLNLDKEASSAVKGYTRRYDG